MTAIAVPDTDEWIDDLDPFALLDLALGRIAAMDVSDSIDRELASDVVRLRRRMDRTDAVFAEWTLAAHRRGAGAVDGYRSTKSWLGWKTGMHPGLVQRALDAAVVGELLPEVGAGWRGGTISSAAVATLAAARVPAHDEKFRALEPEFLDFARRGDHASLRRAATFFKHHAQADGVAPAEPDGLRLSKVLDDRAKITGEISGLAAETVATALDAFMDPPAEGDDRSDAQRRADALVRICEIALERGACGTRAAAHVTVIVDWTTITAGVFGRMDGQFTGPLPRTDVERLLCDCAITRVVTGPTSKPLDVGRTTRVWSPLQRAAISARDTHCRWPGCEIPAPWCEIHHHQEWQHGGETSAGNGHLLCSHHHHFLHRHPGWTTTFEDQTLRVFRPDGRELHPNPWLD
ncbi:MAG: DUF222 domain-containing protein [Acidimicrobiia bacterium]